MKCSRKVKIAVIFLFAIVVGLFSCLVYMNTLQEATLTERDKAVTDEKYYSSKMEECTGIASTDNAFVNSADLSDCGGRMAVQSLRFASMRDIYHIYCHELAYGCAKPSIGMVYVCTPGSTIYEKKYAYSTRYYIYYNVISGSCGVEDSKNTIRHELLHLVYSELSYAEKASVDASLAAYRGGYSNELASYSASERDSELFVRVGADGRQVDDIRLIDLYSQVSSVYASQKESYYLRLATESESYVKKYNDLSAGYSIWCAILAGLIVIDIVALICLGVAYKKSTNENTTSKKKSIWRLPIEEIKNQAEYSDSDEYRLESLRKEIENMDKKPKKDIIKDFEVFKKQFEK